MSYYNIRQEEWDMILKQLMLSYTIFDTISNEFGQDYELLEPSEIPLISYNRPKHATPLNSFFTPVTENVTSVITEEKPRIIIGIPSCDIERLYHVTFLTNIIYFINKTSFIFIPEILN